MLLTLVVEEQINMIIARM